MTRPQGTVCPDNLHRQQHSRKHDALYRHRWLRWPSGPPPVLERGGKTAGGSCTSSQRRRQPGGRLWQLGQRRLHPLLLALACARGGDTPHLHKKDEERDGACDTTYFPPAKNEHKFETLKELRRFMKNLAWGMEQHKDSDKLGIINNIKFY